MNKTSAKTSAKQPAQEPVAIVTGHIEKSALSDTINKMLPINTELYPHPAPSWQGLAGFEIERMWMRSIKEKGISGEDWVIGFARAIEQALKEKNT